MEIASPQPTGALTAGPEPAFGQRWNGWAVFLIFLTVLFLFYVIQLIVTIVLIYSQFAHVIADYISRADQAGLAKFFTSPEGLARIFSPLNLLLIQIFSGGSLVGLTLLFGRVLGASARDFGLAIPARWKPILIGVGGGLALWLLSILVEAAQEKIFGPHPQAIIKVFAFHHGALAFTFDIVAVAVIAPIAEELFFRGMLFTALVQRMSLPWAATISGFVFGLSHIEPWNIVPLSILGIGLAYVYYRTRTIWANICAHAAINAISLTLAFFAPQFGGS